MPRDMFFSTFISQLEVTASGTYSWLNTTFLAYLLKYYLQNKVHIKKTLLTYRHGKRTWLFVSKTCKCLSAEQPQIFVMQMHFRAELVKFKLFMYSVLSTLLKSWFFSLWLSVFATWEGHFLPRGQRVTKTKGIVRNLLLHYMHNNHGNSLRFLCMSAWQLQCVA